MRKLTQQDILDKVFNTKFKGYNPEEVDRFLDVVIDDYRSYEEEIQQLKIENEQLVQRLESIEERSTLTSPSEKPTIVTNFDVLKRLSNLEREVFGSKLEEIDE